MFEVGYNQSKRVEDILKKQGYSDITINADIQGIQRVVRAKL